MKKVLITGANRGIGLEFVKQYLAQDYQVIACCRAPERARDLQALACTDLQVLSLDVAESDSIRGLAAQLKGQSLSVFINNAGVYGEGQSLAEIDEKEWLRVFQINTIAPLLLTRLLLPLMDTHAPAKLAYLSSKMGSIAENSSGGTYVYRSSKTALNQVIKSLAVDLADQGLLVAALHPGWVQTEMGGPNGLINAETSVRGMLSVLAQLELSGTGKFYNYDGSEIPW